eukprot:311140-Hanusia_phi.AAC.1
MRGALPNETFQVGEEGSEEGKRREAWRQDDWRLEGRRRWRWWWWWWWLRRRRRGGGGLGKH